MERFTKGDTLETMNEYVTDTYHFVWLTVGLSGEVTRYNVTINDWLLLREGLLEGVEGTRYALLTDVFGQDYWEWVRG